ncbi:hypothetical protein D7V91_03540 [bacterium 1xD42-67]|nr:hypothetical protein D7V91_03540 [bacterium 1xD42-67]
MYNDELVTSFLRKEGRYPPDEPEKPFGLSVELEKGQLLLSGTAADLIGLADLLVSLALSGAPRGQHWHIDDLDLMDSDSQISELILLRK